MERPLFLSMALLPASAILPISGHTEGGWKNTINSIKKGSIPKPIRLLYATGKLLYHLYCNRNIIDRLLKDFQQLYAEVGWQGLMDIKNSSATKKVVDSLLSVDKSERQKKTGPSWKKWKNWAKRLKRLLTDLPDEDWKELLEALNNDIILKDSFGNIVKDRNGNLILVGSDHPVFRNVWKILSIAESPDQKQKPAYCL